jgi:hypothetical protein
LGLGPAKSGQTARALALHQRPECFADQLGALSQTTDLLRLREQFIVKSECGTHGLLLWTSDKALNTASNDGLFYANTS